MTKAELIKQLRILVEYVTKQRKKAKDYLNNIGKNFFIKYYEILKTNSLMDALDFIEENSNRETNKKRILYAKKIFNSDLEYFALEIILTEESILENGIILKAKKLFVDESINISDENKKVFALIEIIQRQLNIKEFKKNKLISNAYEDVKKEYFIKNAGNSGNKEQKGEDYKRELRGHLYKVGVVYFLKYYYDLKLKSVEEICNCITEKISLESKKNIANNAKKIFESQLNIPILREIVSSKDFERVDVKKAEKILLQETYGIY